MEKNTNSVRVYTNDMFLPKEISETIGAKAGSGLIVSFDEETNKLEIAIAPELGIKKGFMLADSNGMLRARNILFRIIPKGNYTIEENYFDGEIDWFELEKED